MDAIRTDVQHDRFHAIVRGHQGLFSSRGFKDAIALLGEFCPNQGT